MTDLLRYTVFLAAYGDGGEIDLVEAWSASEIEDNPDGFTDAKRRFHADPDATAVAVMELRVPRQPVWNALFPGAVAAEVAEEPT